MNNRPVAMVGGVLTLLGVLLVTLFVYQNHLRTTQLSLDLGFVAWQLKQDVMVPALMAICFGAGFFVAAILFGWSSWRANTKVRRLEAELALSGGGKADGWR